MDTAGFSKRHLKNHPRPFCFAVLILQINDFKLQQHYAVLGYGLTEDWDIYVKFGIADLKAKKFDFGDPTFSWSINFDNNFSWGWGTRYTFFKQDNIAWGITAQMNWIDTDSTANIAPDHYKWGFDSYDILIATGPTVDMGGWKVYGGPFYYYLKGDYDLKVYDGANLLYYTETADVRADRNWGGFVGSIVELGQNCKWTVEYSTTGKGWGIGTGIAWTF